MTDAATFMRTVLDGLGPTNQIARALVNRLELADDKQAEAEVISDELDEIWQVITELTVRVAFRSSSPTSIGVVAAALMAADAFAQGIERLEAEANDETNRP